ncbi:MAG: PIN domain-containing protein [Planctomycetota bacterium]
MNVPCFRVYLDNCCLNRPFDDPGQDRIKLEVEAIAVIVRKVRRGEWVWVTSEILETERAANPNEVKKALVSQMFASPFEPVVLTWADTERALELCKLGMKAYDAFHVAAAERGKCDVLLTTDDPLIAKARKIGKQLRVAVANPVDWLLECL